MFLVVGNEGWMDLDNRKNIGVEYYGVPTTFEIFVQIHLPSVCRTGPPAKHRLELFVLEIHFQTFNGVSAQLTSDRRTEGNSNIKHKLSSLILTNIAKLECCSQCLGTKHWLTLPSLWTACAGKETERVRTDFGAA